MMDSDAGSIHSAQSTSSRSKKKRYHGSRRHSMNKITTSKPDMKQAVASETEHTTFDVKPYSENPHAHTDEENRGGKEDNQEDLLDDKKLYDKYRGAFTNLGYCDVSGDEEAQAIDQLLKTISDKTDEVEVSMAHWKRHNKELKRNRKLTHEAIEERKIELLDLVTEYADTLHDKIDHVMKPRLNSVHDVMSKMSSLLHDIQEVTEETTHGEPRDIATVRNGLESISQRMDESMVTPSPWTPMVLLDNSRSKLLVSSLFGNLEGGATSSGWLAGFVKTTSDLPNVIKVKGQEGEDGEFEDIEEGKANEEEISEEQHGGESRNTSQETPSLLLDKVIVSKKFSSKTKKDRRDIGITDSAVTPSGHILLVDKHNKLVKMFDADGAFQKFIGYKFVKGPSRVTVLCHSGQILVSCHSSKMVKIFSQEGAYIGQFAGNLDHPIAHCETFDQKIAVIDFSTCNVVIYESSGKALHYFETGLVCPAYISCTRNGHIIVTDWKSSIIKIFDVTGKLIKELTSGSDDIDRPYGVCGDAHGHIIMVDRSDSPIRIFSEDGEPIRSISQKDTELKLPMTLCYNGYDSIVVVEYQGCVRIIKYLNLPNTIQAPVTKKTPAVMTKAKGGKPGSDHVKLQNMDSVEDN